MAALIAASLALRVQTIRLRDELLFSMDMTGAVEALVREAGLEILPNPAQKGLQSSLNVIFRRPGCAMASYAVPFGFKYDGQFMIDRLGMTNPVVRYVYFDHVAVQQNRPRVLVEWMKQQILWLTGMDPRLPADTILAVAEAPQCADAASPDWRNAWHKKYLRPAANPPLGNAP